MNESGGPTKAFMLDQNGQPDQLLIVVDDFMIPFGTLRLRPDGSSGGHNGLKSIIGVLGHDQFPRLRVGVGPVPEYKDPADFVLEKFNKADRAALSTMYQAIEETIAKIEAEGIEKAMNWTNKSHLQ
jgi:PTH1 family peptidyl-tRNA hydrolase